MYISGAWRFISRVKAIQNKIKKNLDETIYTVQKD